MENKPSNQNIGIMTSLSEVTNLLSERGYTMDLNLKPHYLQCAETSQKLFPGEFTVDRHYRFEGASNPDDEAIVFAISSPKHNLKGVLIGGYGVSSDPISDEMIKALDEREHRSD